MVKTVSLLTMREKKLLVVLSKKHTLWTPPSGKINPTDSNPSSALIREVWEGLGVSLKNMKEYLGFGGISASGQPVYVDTFLADIEGRPMPANEIKEIRWIGCSEEELKAVSPVTKDIMLCMQADGYLS